MKPEATTKTLLGVVGALAVLLSACVSQPRPDSERALSQIETLESVPEPPAQASIPPAELTASAVPAEGTPDYRIGPGDGIRVTVVGQPDVTGQHVVGPDGSVSVPLAGTVALRGDTRDRAAERIGDRLQTFFLEPLRVTVEVTDYRNNKAYVLGRVERPGVVDLTGAGTLLQVLAEAGGLPVREYRSFLARCAIIRGRNQILWIDLIDLLQGGNVSLNVPLRNGDVVFIPDSEDATVFVMGEVAAPGAVPIKVRLDLVQALAQAGGPTEDAELESVFLIRPNGADGFGAPIRIDFKALIETGDFRENVELKAGDILFVARNGMGDVNYVLRKLQPSFAALTLGVAVR